jgi:hypothetical protein
MFLSSGSYAVWNGRIRLNDEKKYLKKRGLEKF